MQTKGIFTYFIHLFRNCQLTSLIKTQLLKILIAILSIISCKLKPKYFHFDCQNRSKVQCELFFVFALLGSESVIILSQAATIVHAASSLQFSALMCAKSKRNYGRQQLLSVENVKSKHFFFNSFIKFILNFNPILTVKGKILGSQFATYERQNGNSYFQKLRFKETC